MASVPKILSITALLAAFGFALYETNAAVRLHDDVLTGRQNLDRLNRDVHEASLAAKDAIRQFTRRGAAQPPSRNRFPAGSDAALEEEITGWLSRLGTLKQTLADHPELGIPELQLLTEEEWFNAARNYQSKIGVSATEGIHSEPDVPASLVFLRDTAQRSLMDKVMQAVEKYRRKNSDALPEGLDPLGPLLPAALSPAMLARYDLSIEGDRFVLAEKPSAAIDPNRLAVYEFDNRPSMHRSFLEFETPLARQMHEAARRFSADHAGANPTEPAQLAPFLPPTVEAAVLAEEFARLPENARGPSPVAP